LSGADVNNQRQQGQHHEPATLPNASSKPGGRQAREPGPGGFNVFHLAVQSSVCEAKVF